MISAVLAMKNAACFALGSVFFATLGAACSSTTVVEGGSSSAAAAGADAGTGATGGTGTGGASASGGAGGSGGASGASGSATGGSGGTGGAAGSATGGAGGSGGTAGAGCPSDLPGPSLVFVDGFCIDSTEVTGEQYEAFVTAKAGDTSGQSSACAQNGTYIPDDTNATWPIPTDRMQWPMNYVDWCDAYEYCRWAGKRLCGKIGGGPNPFESYADETQSQWYRVCSNAGRNAYPYGSNFDETKCNGYGAPDGCYKEFGGTSPLNCTRADVGSYTQCQGSGAYAGVYDLSGNVLEWEDSCTTDPATNQDLCRTRGGAIYAQSEFGMTCDVESSADRLGSASGTGFRCCYQ